MNYLKNLFLVTGLVLLSGLLIHAVTADYDGEKSPVNDTDKAVKDYNVYTVTLPKELSFAGEKMPLEDLDVRERIDREFLVNTYWQSNGFLLIKRANKYFPILEPILKKNGIPDDFKYLAVIESGLQQVVSPAKAVGFWQLLSATGKGYGLEINENVDERYHIEKSTEAACAYLKKAKEQFGSWTLAAAAYNAGMAGVQKQIDRQKETDYYRLLFTEETDRYVFRMVAVKEILSNPKKYGFNIEKEDLYAPVPTRTLEIDSAITDLAGFAKKHNLSYRILKRYNPWLRDAFLDNKTGKKYQIAIPREEYRQHSE